MSKRPSEDSSEPEDFDLLKSLLEMGKLTHRFISGGFSGREVARILELGNK